MLRFLRHIFIPHFSNNQRAKLIHSQTIFLITLFLIGTSFFVATARQHVSGVLGISVNIATSDLLTVTNQKRADAGLAPLQLNNQLSQAAEAKAQDMFAKDYWAHFAPDGTSPWDFIHAAGYNYVYAGENLARGFTTTNDVINAWMASSEHRANMLSGNYTDVGFAVATGRLPGDSDTVLVVEEFGSQNLGPVVQKSPPVVAIEENAQQVAQQVQQTPTPTLLSPTPAITPVLSVVKRQPLVDSAFLTKVVSLCLLSLFLIIFGIDVVMTENRKTVRLAGHSFDHLLFLIGILIIAVALGLGAVV